MSVCACVRLHVYVCVCECLCARWRRFAGVGEEQVVSEWNRSVEWNPTLPSCPLCSPSLPFYFSPSFPSYSPPPDTHTHSFLPPSLPPFVSYVFSILPFSSFIPHALLLPFSPTSLPHYPPLPLLFPSPPLPVVLSVCLSLSQASVYFPLESSCRRLFVYTSVCLQERMSSLTALPLAALRSPQRP